MEMPIMKSPIEWIREAFADAFDVLAKLPPSALRYTIFQI
jgi:hypothetical protein